MSYDQSHILAGVLKITWRMEYATFTSGKVLKLRCNVYEYRLKNGAKQEVGNEIY